MERGSNINELARNLNAMAKGHVKVQTAWAVVKSVDWDNKTMVATGVLDELDYEDVLLGVGGNYKKPTLGAHCLLGLIENQDGAAFLLDAESVDEYSLNAGQTVLKSDGNNLSILSGQENLLDVFTMIIESVQKIIVFQGQNPDYVKLESALEKVNKILK